MKTVLGAQATADLIARLERANQAFELQYPGEMRGRQPVHSVYGGAHLFRADITSKLGSIALSFLDQYASDFPAFANAIGLAGGDGLLEVLSRRIRDKLLREPVEDYRIDFEDGYGIRSDSEEDEHAVRAARETAKGMEEATLPPFFGIRIKSLHTHEKARALRTLDLFLSALCEHTQGKLPSNFVVTLPKVSMIEHVQTLAALFELMERELHLPAGTLKMELMVETPQSIINERGEMALPQWVRAADGRCSAVHFGAYDYTAACHLTAVHQHLSHPMCDAARYWMQAALSSTGVWLSDGATNVLPVPIHRQKELSSEQLAENKKAVHEAWKRHFEDVRHSLAQGFYQGWDLHPAQLITRYAALYDFYESNMDAMAARLRAFLEKAARATVLGTAFDDAATGRGLLNFFLRAIDCGAISESEVLSATGLSTLDLQSGALKNIFNVIGAPGQRGGANSNG